MFGDHAFFSDVNGKSNVVCFRNMANTITNGKWYEDKNSNIDDEAKRIVTTTAKLIKSQIKEKKLQYRLLPVNGRNKRFKRSNALIFKFIYGNAIPV